MFIVYIRKVYIPFLGGEGLHSFQYNVVRPIWFSVLHTYNHLQFQNMINLTSIHHGGYQHVLKKKRTPLRICSIVHLLLPHLKHKVSVTTFYWIFHCTFVLQYLHVGTQNFRKPRRKGKK